MPLLDSVERIAIALEISPCWLAFGPEGEGPFRQKVTRTPERLRKSGSIRRRKPGLPGSQEAPERGQRVRLAFGEGRGP